MASLDCVTHGGRNTWRVRVYIRKKREVISLGAFDEADSVAAQGHIERLLDAKERNRFPSKQTRQWVDGIPSELHERLAVLGLVEPKSIIEAERTLIAYLRAYVKQRTDWKKPENYKQAIDKLESYLKKDVPLGTLKRSDVERWHRWMIHTLKLSPNTAGQNVKRCRQIMNQAVSDELIEQNPFKGVRIDLKSDKTKNRFIDAETSEAILEACRIKSGRSYLLWLDMAGYERRRRPST